MGEWQLCSLCLAGTFQEVKDEAEDDAPCRGWRYIHLVLSERNNPRISHPDSVRHQVLRCESSSCAKTLKQRDLNKINLRSPYSRLLTGPSSSHRWLWVVAVVICAPNWMMICNLRHFGKEIENGWKRKKDDENGLTIPASCMSRIKSSAILPV